MKILFLALSFCIFTRYSIGSPIENLKTNVESIPTVKVLLLIPKGEVNLDGIEEKISIALKVTKEWYANQLGGRTFTISTSNIEKIFLQESVSQFANEGTRKSYSAEICYLLAQKYSNVKTDDPKNIWLVFIAGGEFISHGGSGFACMSSDPFYAVRHRTNINTITGFQAIVAHELGHALGIDHAEDWYNNRSLMGRWGGVLFPNKTFLLDSDKKILFTSPFIRKPESP
jgi:hypothetical protein